MTATEKKNINEFLKELMGHNDVQDTVEFTQYLTAFKDNATNAFGGKDVTQRFIYGAVVEDVTKGTFTVECPSDLPNVITSLKQDQTASKYFFW
mmetsp:Transcript_14003/g.15471  ORF Transcript_14003/g.15471 Transcript_14003/m.15471 type:complete len:94 (+) Transcript_14003:33-314(+)